MSAQQSITASTTREAGRYLIESDGKVMLSDSALVRQIPSIAPGPIELLVSALGSCVLASAEADAIEHGLSPSALRARVTSTRDAQDETLFSSIRVEIEVAGIAQEDAPKLLGHLLNQCPIFNTLRRGGRDVTAAITVVG
jgi:uncharacterized OsmC-like protein